MERREVIGVSAVILSSGALIGATQLSTTGEECTSEIIHNSTREIFSGQEWSKEVAVSEAQPTVSVDVQTNNEQEIRAELLNPEEELVQEQSGNTISTEYTFEETGIAELRLYNTGTLQEKQLSSLWSNETETLGSQDELSLWIQGQEDNRIVYNVQPADESVDGTLEFQIENESEEVLEEQTLSSSGTMSGSFTPNEAGRYYFRFTNTNDEEIDWEFSFEREVAVEVPVTLDTTIILSSEICTTDEIQSVLEQTEDDEEN